MAQEYPVKNIQNGEEATLRIDGRKGKPNHVWFETPDGVKYEIHPVEAAKLAGHIEYLTRRPAVAPEE